MAPSTAMMRQQSVPNRMAPQHPPSQHQSLSPVPRRRRISNKSVAAPKPKPRLLVDYSTQKADLSPNKARGPGLRRTKSLDQQERQKFFHQKRHILSRNQKHAQSARQVVPVDWNKLSNELEWEEQSQSTSNTGTGAQQRETSCSDVLRQSFLNKPLGASHSHLQQMQRDREIRNQAGTLEIPISRRSRSNSPVQKLAKPKRVQKQLTHGNHRGPPPKNHLGLPKNQFDLSGGGMLDDSSLHIGDVFGSRRDEPPPPPHPNKNNATISIQKSESEDSKDEQTNALIQRLTQDAAPPLTGRLYQSLSASMNAVLSPLERKLERKRSKHKSKQKQKSTDSVNSDVSSLTNDTGHASLSFPRKSNASTSTSPYHSPTEQNQQHSPQKLLIASNHLGGSLPIKPWDDDFDNSVSSMSSHWESMDDDTYAQEQKKRESTNTTNGTKKDHSPKKRDLVASLTGSALDLNHNHEDNDDSEQEDEDLLFLPKKPTATTAATASKKKPFRKPELIRENSLENSNQSLTIQDGLFMEESNQNSNSNNNNNAYGNSNRRMSSSARNNNSFSSTRSNNNRRRHSSDRNMQFNIRRGNSGSRERSNPKLNNSLDSLESFSGDEEDYLDEQDKKSRKRQELVKNRDRSKSPPPNRRQQLRKQLSCERLDSEYDRFKRKNTLQKTHSSRSVSPRRNAALLAKAESVPKKVDQASAMPVKMASTSRLMNSMSNLNLVETRSESPPSSNARNNRNKMSEGIASIRGKGLQKQSSRRGLATNSPTSPTSSRKMIGRSKSFDDDKFTARQLESRGKGLQKQSSRRGLMTNSPTNSPTNLRKTIGESSSIDDDAIAARQKDSRGFRESMLRQASFVTGSRIRRLNKFGGAGNNSKTDFNASFNMGSREFSKGGGKKNGTLNMHMSSPDLSFDF